jgi:hypothetical protein
METYQLLETLYQQTAFVRAPTLPSLATINPETVHALYIPKCMSATPTHTHNFSHFYFHMCQTTLSRGKPSHYSHVGLLLEAVGPGGLASKVPSFSQARCFVSAGFLLHLLFSLEDGGNMFL